MLRFEGTGFWVNHEGSEYGPFDYDWNKDYRSVNLLFQGHKFGEYVGRAEHFADLSELCLPREVGAIGTVALVSICCARLEGWSADETRDFLYRNLDRLGDTL